jgi:hypothetical protein
MSTALKLTTPKNGHHVTSTQHEGVFEIVFVNADGNYQISRWKRARCTKCAVDFIESSGQEVSRLSDRKLGTNNGSELCNCEQTRFPQSDIVLQ